MTDEAQQPTVLASTITVSKTEGLAGLVTAAKAAIDDAQRFHEARLVDEYKSRMLEPIVLVSTSELWLTEMLDKAFEAARTEVERRLAVHLLFPRKSSSQKEKS